MEESDSIKTPTSEKAATAEEAPQSTSDQEKSETTEKSPEASEQSPVTLQLQDNEAILRIAEDDKRQAKKQLDTGSSLTAVLPPNGRVSEPGAWSTNPLRRSNDAENDDRNVDDGTSEELSQDLETGDGAGVFENDVSEKILVEAELVEDRPEEPAVPPPKPAEIVVDAELLNNDDDMKRRRRIGIVGVATSLAILVTVIVLSVVLTARNSDGSSSSISTTSNASDQQPNPLVSANPTISVPPSPLPSMSPSLLPTNVPSQSPTRLVWQQVQVLQGIGPVPIPNSFPIGGGEFGISLQISDILETPLSSRTGARYLVTAQYGGILEFSGPLSFSESPATALYLCEDSYGMSNSSTEEWDASKTPCRLVEKLIGYGISSAAALSGTTFVATYPPPFDRFFDLFQLGSIDLIGDVETFGPDPTLRDTLSVPAYHLALEETGETDTCRIVTAAIFEVEELTISPLILESTAVLSSSSDLMVSERKSQLLFPGSTESFTVAVSADHTVTVQASRRTPNCQFNLCGVYPYDGYRIIHQSKGFSSSGVPVLEIATNTSVFSRKGFALNQNATRIAVSSALIEAETNTVDFQVDIFQLVDLEWVPMGSTIFNPSSGDRFGESLDMNADGTVLVVGASEDDSGGGFNDGSVYTFEWNGEDWESFGEVLYGPPGSKFGSSVALSPDGETLLVGAPFSDLNGENSGEVQVFRSGGSAM